MEPLVRWAHPIKRMVAPNEFIPLAEETGIIILMRKNTHAKDVCLDGILGMQRARISSS
jgi:EAL domain-containing protein (putative c-di-GMP-specific phosphodiesterase class I)